MSARVVELRAGHRFHVIAAPPFVVVGGGDRSELERFTREVVRRAVKQLREQLFELGPSEVVEIWSLRSAGSYRTWGGRAIGSAPSSPYGQYSPCAGALILNSALGYGTAVHEIVHVLVEADFPGAPTWLDEGLASLFEQSGEQDGRIVGLVNWRLPPLQRALRSRNPPTLTNTMSTWRSEFYGEHSGTHYAVARYLFFYLQGLDKLRTFYRAVRAGEDGADALARVLDAPMPTIERRWRTFVLGLPSEGWNRK